METSTPTAADVVAGARLAYVSDYFSFAGQDARGHGAFALDSNRRRDGDSYQAQIL